MSFDGELAIVRAMLRSNPERRGWLAAEGFLGRPFATPEHKPALPSALSLRGRERGGWACGLRESFAEKFCRKKPSYLDGV